MFTDIPIYTLHIMKVLTLFDYPYFLNLNNWHFTVITILIIRWYYTSLISWCCFTTLNPLNSDDEINTSKIAPQPPKKMF